MLTNSVSIFAGKLIRWPLNFDLRHSEMMFDLLVWADLWSLDLSWPLNFDLLIWVDLFLIFDSQLFWAFDVFLTWPFALWPLNFEGHHLLIWVQKQNESVQGPCASILSQYHKTMPIWTSKVSKEDDLPILHRSLRKRVSLTIIFTIAWREPPFHRTGTTTFPFLPLPVSRDTSWHLRDPLGLHRLFRLTKKVVWKKEKQTHQTSDYEKSPHQRSKTMKFSSALNRDIKMKFFRGIHKTQNKQLASSKILKKSSFLIFSLQ